MTAETDRHRAPGVRGTVSVVALVAIALASLSWVLSVNVFPTVTNDGVVYLDHSLHLGRDGLVSFGYRQFGYPLFLAAVRGASGLVNAEPLLMVAAVQRTLLVLGGVLALWSWRWWSVPLLALLFTPTTIAYSNLFLTESFGISLAVLLAITTARFLEVRRSQHRTAKAPRMWMLGSLAVALALLLFSVRFTYVVFGVVPLAIAVTTWRSPQRRIGLTMLAFYVVFAGTLTLLFAIENQRELGTLTPSAGGDASRYYYAWIHVFRGEFENQEDPALAPFYDDGSVHDFNREVTALDLSYEEQTELFDREIEAMFETAGISPWIARAEATAASALGGRVHDVQSVTEGIANSTTANMDDWIYYNSFAMSQGQRAFAVEYNDSRDPETIVTDRLEVDLPAPDTHTMSRVLIPASLLVLTIGIAPARTRAMSLVGLVALAATVVGLGWLWADNFRFLLPSVVFGVAAATAVAQVLSRWRRSHSVGTVT